MAKRPTPSRRRRGAESRTALRSYGAKRPTPSRRRRGAESRTAPSPYGTPRLRQDARRRGDAVKRGANIILIGFMGSGKTTVGRSLARQLHWRFLDLDRAVEAATGRRVADLFRRHGEARFRRLEHREIRGLADLRKVVVAAGGGAPTYPPNRPWLRRAGLLVHLSVPVNVLVDRLGGGAGRPLLAAAGGEPRRLRPLIGRLLRARRRAYAAADMTIHAGVRSPARVARQIAAATRTWRLLHGL